MVWEGNHSLVLAPDTPLAVLHNVDAHHDTETEPAAQA
jgi:hypothetical protein